MARKNNKDRGLFEKKRGSGIWSVEWYDHRGNRHRKQIGPKMKARKYNTAVKALVQAIKDEKKKPEELVKQGYLRLSALGEEKELTLGQFIDECLPELSQLGSWPSIKGHAVRWKKLIGDLPLSEVSAVHARKQRAARQKKGRANSTCNREVEFLRAILNRAVDQEILEKNPLSTLKDLPEDNKRVRYLTDSEELRLEAEMTPEDFELVAVAMDTGFRRGKVFNLPWLDVNLDHGWVAAKKAKAGSSREIPMTDRVRDILTRRRAAKTSHFVFPNPNKKPMDAANFVNRIFKPALERAGIEDFRWHDLRHTFCSRLVMRGVPLRAVMELAGHRDFKTTLRYAHLAPEAFSSAIEVLNRPVTNGGLRVIK